MGGLSTDADVKGTPAYRKKKKKQAEEAGKETAATVGAVAAGMEQAGRGRKRVDHEKYGGEFGKQITSVYQRPSLQHLSKVGPMMTGPKYSRYFAVTTTPTGSEIKSLYERRKKGGAYRGDFGELGFATPKGSLTYDGKTRTQAEWEAIEPNWTAGYALPDRSWACPPSDPECAYLKWYKKHFRSG